MRTGQRRGDRNTQKSVKFGLRWWSWRQQLVETREVAPRGWRRGGDYARTSIRTRTPTRTRVLLASRAPAAASLRPAACASSARRRPASRPSAVAPPRLAPCGLAPPLRPGPAPGRLRAGPRLSGVRREGHNRTWTAGVCARGGVRPGPLAPPPRSRGPYPCPAPTAAARPLRRAGGGGVGRGPAPGGRGGRSPLPQAARGWKRPSAGLVHCVVTAAGRGGGLGQCDAALAVAKSWAPFPAV